jgi:hypothetical protein
MEFNSGFKGLMYELKKKIEKVFMGKFVGTGPSSYGKKNLPGRGLTKVEKQRNLFLVLCNQKFRTNM